MQRRLPDCFYCGFPATTRDHSIPVSILWTIIRNQNWDLLEQLKAGYERGELVVPACRECNSLLAAGLDYSLEERKLRLKGLLKKKYKRYLDLPDWNEKELAEMGYSLLEWINSSLAFRNNILMRLEW